MNTTVSRRDFLKISGLSLAALAFQSVAPKLTPWPPEEFSYPEMTGRVTKNNIYVYAQPDLESRRILKIKRDTILHLFEEVISTKGPDHNPRWYQLANGYIHSAYIQRVEKARLNTPLSSVSETGQLGEITVPYSQTMYKNRKGFWMPLYRLYYRSIHWITGAVDSPDGEPWYELTDEWLKVRYYIPAEHMRPVFPEELIPISPEIPANEKRIEVSIDHQLLTAFERDQIVLQTKISSGKRYMETPKGDFQVERKFPTKHMGDGGLTSNINAYELVGVPWVSFFHSAGIAFHGTYWHDNFGSIMSHGCVNMRNEDAKWLFRWTAPIFDPDVEDRSGWKITGNGTSVTVF